MASKPKYLPPIYPNAGIEADYRRKLKKLIEEMHDSVVYWVLAAYKANEPEMAKDSKLASDELPYAALRRVMNKLARRWQKKFKEAGPALGAYYATQANKRSAKTLEKVLRDAGFTIDFKMTRAMKDAMNAAVVEQVALISNIPQQYFTGIQGAVMRAVQTGGKLDDLKDTLNKQHGIEKRRAAFIARDQWSKANAVCVRVRQQELGIQEAVWMHSHAGKVPRPTHLANNNKKYDVAKGWYDPDAHGKGKGAWVHPGELINCRCVSKSVLPTA